MFREHRESGLSSFRELPGTMLGNELHVHRRVSAGATSTARMGDGGGVGGRGLGSKGRGGGGGTALGLKESTQSFAVLTSMGIYHGTLALGNQVRTGR